MPGGVNTSPAQPCSPSTCTHLFRPPRSHPILEVSQFEYLGLILDPKLTMHLTTVEAIRRASQGQALALLTRSDMTKTPPNLLSHKTSFCGNPWRCLTSSRTCVTFTATQTLLNCKPASTCPWHESYMYMATTQDSWQTQESLPFNSQ